jgi:hypothetical protein
VEKSKGIDRLMEHGVKKYCFGDPPYVTPVHTKSSHDDLGSDETLGNGIEHQMTPTLPELVTEYLELCKKNFFFL